jgi:hypothetical protein
MNPDLKAEQNRRSASKTVHFPQLRTAVSKFAKQIWRDSDSRHVRRLRKLTLPTGAASVSRIHKRLSHNDASAPIRPVCFGVASVAVEILLMMGESLPAESLPSPDQIKHIQETHRLPEACHCASVRSCGPHFRRSTKQPSRPGQPIRLINGLTYSRDKCLRLWLANGDQLIRSLHRKGLQLPTWPTNLHLLGCRVWAKTEANQGLTG